MSNTDTETDKLKKAAETKFVNSAQTFRDHRNLAAQYLVISRKEADPQKKSVLKRLAAFFKERANTSPLW